MRRPRAPSSARSARLRRHLFAALLVLLVVVVQAGFVAFAVAAERRQVADRLLLATRDATRLAVAQLDAMLVPLVAAESARPSAHFDPFVDSGPTPGPSPLLFTELPFRLLHFTWAEADGLRSPQVPRATLRPLLSEHGTEPGAILDRALRNFDALEKLVPRRTWEQMLVRSEAAPSPLLAGPTRRPIARGDFPTSLSPELATNFTRRLAGGSEEGAGGMRPSFLRAAEADVDVLVLARRVETAAAPRLEGVWIDWPKLRVQLLEHVGETVRGRAVQLVPLTRAADVRADARLAALPAALIVGELEWPEPLGFSPTRVAVGVASLAVLVALSLGAWALFAAWELGERRARFAGGVTHELRTPLTTFQLYSELLAEDRIQDPERRREALETLRSESARLARVVENVLAQSRLERGSARLSRDPVDVGALLLRLTPHLARRCREAGLSLDAHLPDEGAVVCSGDGGAIEQIIVNLVDNAAKYANGGADPRVELDVTGDEQHVSLRVRDHGPGVPRERRSELFQAFSRAGAGPHTQGLGLGLSLSRDLAREMSGDLVHEAPEDGGAAFVLRLARARVDGARQVRRDFA